MSKVGRVSALAVALVVLLRIAIGWQLFYEGIWKINTLSTPSPWTSAGYLKNSQGPLRSVFRAMAGDPDDLDWLNYESVMARWNNWHARFVSHYHLDDKQKSRLNSIINGNELYVSNELASVPASVIFKKLRVRVGPGAEGVISPMTFNAEKRRLEVDGRSRLKASEKKKILDMAPWDGQGEMPADLKAFYKAVDEVAARAARLSYKEKLRATLLGDPNLVGSQRNQQPGELKKYKAMLAEYERQRAIACQDFQYNHLAKLWSDIQTQRSALVGPVKALDAELKDAAEKIVRIDQMQKYGGLGEPWTVLRISDTLTILGLTCLGAMLMAGLFTRFSAIMAAIMLLMFYLPMPPLPGLPPAPGPEHSLIVNKTLIEVVALVAIAALPTGYWFGLDKLLAKLRPRKSNTD